MKDSILKYAKQTIFRSTKLRFKPWDSLVSEHLSQAQYAGRLLGVFPQ